MRAQREGEPSGWGRHGATHFLQAPRVVGSRRRARTCGPRHVRRTQHTVGTGYTDSCACKGGPGPAAIIIMAGYLYGFTFFITVSELFQNTATLFQNSFRTVSEVSEQGLLGSWFQNCFRTVSELFQNCFRTVSELFQNRLATSESFPAMVILRACARSASELMHHVRGTRWWMVSSVFLRVETLAVCGRQHDDARVRIRRGAHLSPRCWT